MSESTFQPAPRVKTTAVNRFVETLGRFDIGVAEPFVAVLNVHTFIIL
jgi:hypothetical protein